MEQYLKLVKHIRDNGNYKGDRTGTGTLSVFGYQMRFDISNGKFPLVTSKHTHLKSIIHELLWFLKGETNIRYLAENGVRIWNEWVLPGTAEYRDMTPGEIQVALAKHFNVTDFTPVQNDSLGLSGAYEIIRDEDDEDRIVFEYVDNASWLNAYRILLDKEPRVLIAGELGPVYGSQWRNWPVAQQTTVDALIELSCLGNGSRWGNSDGNLIAQKALLDIPGIVHNKRAYMSSGYSYEDWAKRATKKKDITSTRGGIDQIANLIEMLKKNPDSRRLIVSAWNPAEVDNMALQPCHTMFQFYTSPLTGMERWVYGLNHGYFEENEGRGQFGIDEFLDQKGVPTRKLSCQLYQRKHHCAF